jgi:hypothetical protein
MWLNGVTALDEGLGPTGPGSGCVVSTGPSPGRVMFGIGGAEGPDLSPGCMILRFSCCKEPIIPLEGRGFVSGGGAPDPILDFSGSGRLVVVVVGIEGGVGLDIN